MTDKAIDDLINNSLSPNLEENLGEEENLYIGLYRQSKLNTVCVVTERENKIVALGYKTFQKYDDAVNYIKSLEKRNVIAKVAFNEDMDDDDKNLVWSLALAVEAHRNCNPNFGNESRPLMRVSYVKEFDKNKLNYVTRFYRWVRNKVIITRNRIGGFIRIERKKFILNLVLHEKYENLVKNILRLLIILGILTSFISLDLFTSIFVSILLVLIEQFFERTVFLYTTLFIQPIPNPLELKKSNWKAMAFMFKKENNDMKPISIGMVFGDRDSGRNVFNTIRSWNYGKEDDIENNVRLSFVFEDDGEYFTYIYPSSKRKSIENLRKKEMKNEAEKRKHQNLIMTIMLCKAFAPENNKLFMLFKEKYKTGDEINLEAFYLDYNGGLFRIPNCQKIVKYNIKIKNGKDLDQKDEEYVHRKTVLNR